jgi:hypothetical protein
MSAGTRNYELGGPFPAERRESAGPDHPCSIPKTGGERLRVVRMDEPAFPTARALDEANASRGARRPLAEYLAEQTSEELLAEEEFDGQVIPSREARVDLAALQPPIADMGKLAAFLSESPAPSQRASGKPIVMPMPNTDLKDIFQVDKVCMVAQPREKSAAPVTSAASPANSPCAAGSVMPSENASLALDQTQRYLVENWPKLPPNVQAAILNVIEVAIGPDD